MPAVKPSYTLGELEKAWKSFQPSKVKNVELGKNFKMCASYGASINTTLRTQAEAKRWMEFFAGTMGQVHKLLNEDAIKKDANAKAFLEKAADALSGSKEVKALSQIAAGTLTYNAGTKKWEKSAGTKQALGEH